MDKTCWFCGDFSACWCGKVGVGGGGCRRGGLANRVGCVVTFRRVGAEKSVLEVVGANVEDGVKRQIVLVVWRLFGLLVRENRY